MISSDSFVGDTIPVEQCVCLSFTQSNCFHFHYNLFQILKNREEGREEGKRIQEEGGREIGVRIGKAIVFFFFFLPKLLSYFSQDSLGRFYSFALWTLVTLCLLWPYYCFSHLQPRLRGIAQNQDKGLSRDMLVILAEFSLKSVA